MTDDAIAAKIADYAESYAQKQGETLLRVLAKPASLTAPLISGIVVTSRADDVGIYGFEYRVMQSVIAIDSEPMVALKG